MKSPSHFSKSKLKKDGNQSNRIKSFKIEINYVSSLSNNKESSHRQNNQFFSEKNICTDNEFSSLSNCKFLNSDKAINYSSKISSHTSKKKKKNSISSLLCNQKTMKGNRTPNVHFKLPDITSKSRTKITSLFSSSYNIKDNHSSCGNNTLIKNKAKYDIKKLDNENITINNKVSRTPKASKCNLKINNINGVNEKRKSNLRNSLFLNYAQNYNNSPNNRISDYDNTNINCLDYYNDIGKIFKINENIQNELESKELQKKVNLMKKTLVQFNDVENLQKIISDEENPAPSSKEKTKIKNTKLLEKVATIQNKSTEKKSEIKSDIKDMDKKDEKNRKLKRTKEIYDSFDDEEYEEDNEKDIYIPPSCYFIKIYDSIMFASSMVYLFFVPYCFSKDNLILDENKVIIVLLTIIDFIYILDLIFNFFRAYQNFDENLVRNNKFIFLHYIQSWFLFDFFQAFPFYTLFKFFERDCINFNICPFVGITKYKVKPILYLLILIKIVKVYKLFKENDTILLLGEALSQIEFFDNYGYILFAIFSSIGFLNLCACIYIFLGEHTYPGWLNKINLVDEPYIHKYVASVYFIQVTITTVGYGDITGNSYEEIIYQMLLLIIGTITYSFIISYISNYIYKKNQKSLTFEKNLGILKEIKLHNPYLKDTIYHEVLKNLHNEQLYERKDKSLLFDCLPYSLKNKLIMEMYKPFVENFVFFKENENSDFVVKVVTSLRPLIAFKNDILIQEGDFIKEIFFVKKGALSLNITIDKLNVQNSLKKYLGRNELGAITVSFVPEVMKNTTIHNLNDNLYDYFLNRKTEKKLVIKNEINISDIKIIEIRKNEHFGDALMFLNERSPLIVKVKTKVSELLILRKMEAIEIYSIYPNIWKRINKKSLYNMEQIKFRIKKILVKFAKKYGSEAEKNVLKNSESLQRFMTINTLHNNCNDSQNEFDNTKSEKSKKKEKKKNKKKKNKKINSKIIDKAKEYKNENKNDEKEKNEDTSYISNNNDSISSNNNNSKNNNNDNNDNNEDNNNNNSNSNNKDDNINNKIQIIKSNKNSPKDLIFDFSRNQSSKNKETNLSKGKEKDDYIKSFNIKCSSYNSNKSNSPIKIKSYKNGESDDTKKSSKKKIMKHISIPLNLRNIKEHDSIKANDSINILKQSLKFNLTQSEKLFFPSFSNLIITKEKSFQLISSYENLNKITKNHYIRNNYLQNKTKQFLIKECSCISYDSPKNYSLLKKNQLKGQIKLSKELKIKNLKSYFHSEGKIKTVNTFEMSNIKSNTNIIKLNENSESVVQGNQFDSEVNKKRFELCKMRRHESSKIFQKRQSLTNTFEPLFKNKPKINRKRRKSEYLNVNKKLDLITKNIKGANRNINNPEEFYMDFFNHIMQKGSHSPESRKNKRHKSKNSNSFSPKK